ncbi:MULTISPECIES: hypothetical protein [Streptomyces]|uniref:hypothetical protein n=1 Tax=Streptomyces TaxID=1883 RepID=UPI00382D333A
MSAVQAFQGLVVALLDENLPRLAGAALLQHSLDAGCRRGVQIRSTARAEKQFLTGPVRPTQSAGEQGSAGAHGAGRPQQRGH